MPSHAFIWKMSKLVNNIKRQIKTILVSLLKLFNTKIAHLVSSADKCGYSNSIRCLFRSVTLAAWQSFDIQFGLCIVAYGVVHSVCACSFWNRLCLLQRSGLLSTKSNRSETNWTKTEVKHSKPIFPFAANIGVIISWRYRYLIRVNEIHVNMLRLC